MVSSWGDLSPELEQVRLLAREVSERDLRPEALRWERTGEFPWKGIEVLARTGLLGATIPIEYGGGGGGWLEAAVILEEIGRCCYVTAMAALGELGVQSQALVAYGSQEQRRRYLPEIAAGGLVCAICMTEPGVGSDLRSITTRARPAGDGLVVDGRKTLISRADVAGLYLVFVRLQDEGGEDQGGEVGAVLVEKGTPGLRVGQRYQTLGGDGLFEVVFDGCRIPRESVLAGKDGLRRMLAAFNGQRCLNAAISVGIAQGAQDAALDHARQRVQGGRPIAGYQGIQWILADNGIQIEAARLLVRTAAARAAGGFPTRYESAVAKVFANEMALKVTDAVLQIHGGHGWTRDLPAERYVRWARYGPLGGGTPQILRNGIARELLGTGPGPRAAATAAGA